MLLLREADACAICVVGHIFVVSLASTVCQGVAGTIYETFSGRNSQSTM